MPVNSTVQVRLDQATKLKANKVLASMGLSMSDAVRGFLERVAVDKKLPFVTPSPNAESRRTMAEAKAITRARFRSGAELLRELGREGR